MCFETLNYLFSAFQKKKEMHTILSTVCLSLLEQTYVFVSLVNLIIMYFSGNFYKHLKEFKKFIFIRRNTFKRSRYGFTYYSTYGVCVVSTE